MPINCDHPNTKVQAVFTAGLQYGKMSWWLQEICCNHSKIQLYVVQHDGNKIRKKLKHECTGFLIWKNWRGLHNLSN
jgi:hypothetical protein